MTASGLEAIAVCLRPPQHLGSAEVFGLPDLRRNDPPRRTTQYRVRLILVRHGQAGRKTEWRDDDALRPLDANGRRQAQDLVRALVRYRFSRILSSPHVRCRQTVEPLSATRGLQVELSDALAPDAGDKALALVEQLMPVGSPTAVLSTHREVLAEVLPALSTQFDIPVGHRLPGAKGSFWVLEFSKKKLTSVKYQAPKR